jgi:hypothetical protein
LPHAELHSFAPSLKSDTAEKLEIHLPVSRLPLRWYIAIFSRHTRAGDTRPVYVYVKPALSTQSDLVVTIATIDRPTIGRLKRHLGVFAALGAYDRKHLSWEIVVVTTIPISF